MRIGIISTIGMLVAGSEEMWKLFATEALRVGYSVAAMLQTPIAQSDELTEFRALGGVVFAYNPLNRYTLAHRAHGLFPVSAIGTVEPDIVCTFRAIPALPYRKWRSLQTSKCHRGPRVLSYKGTLIGLSAVKPTATHCERFIARPGESSASRADNAELCRGN